MLICVCVCVHSKRIKKFVRQKIYKTKNVIEKYKSGEEAVKSKVTVRRVSGLVLISKSDPAPDDEEKLNRKHVKCATEEFK